jgi:hypothetical protein
LPVTEDTLQHLFYQWIIWKQSWKKMKRSDFNLPSFLPFNDLFLPPSFIHI